MDPTDTALALAGIVCDGDAAADATADELDAVAQQIVSAGSMHDRVALLSPLFMRARDLEVVRRLRLGRWSRWISQVSAIRGMGRHVGHLERCVADARRVSSVRVAVRGDIVDALPDGWRDPPGYRVAVSGVWRNDDDKDARIATRPLWIDRYLIDVDGRGHLVRLVWRQINGAIERRIVPRAVVADARALVALASHGCPVTSSTARDVVEYIEAATATNEGIFDACDVAARFGWVLDGDAPRGFLVGREWIGDDDRPVALTSDPGIEQVADAYAVRGTWDGYLSEVVTPAAGSAVFWLSVYNQIASVLIRVVGWGEPWFLDRSGRTSQGKSTIGRAAAAVWMNPRSIRSWRVSQAGVEAYAATLRDLPLCLDDSKEARRPDDVAAIIYMHSQGRGATRGKPGTAGRGVGLRTTEQWSSAADSSGEQRLTGFSHDAGSRARVLCLVGCSVADGPTARAIQLGAEAHCGHLGRRVLRHLMRPGVVARLRAERPAAVERWAARLVSRGPVAARLARIVAALEMSAELCHAAGLPVPPGDVDPWGLAIESAARGGDDSDQPWQAMQHVSGCAAAHRGQFQHADSGHHSTPAGGWLGRWERGADWKHVDVLVGVVERWLRDGGYDRGTIDRWCESGFLLTPAAGRRHRTSIGGARVSVYRFTRYAINGDETADGG